jgi:hypothetical protein
MYKLIKTLIAHRDAVHADNGYTDLLTIVQGLLAEYDEAEEMDRETAEQLFSDVLDNFYRAE